MDVVGQKLDYEV